MYEPAKGCRIMQVDGAALDAELARRADKHGQPVGIEITEHVGVAGLEAAGLLRGARAMARRVYGAEDWYVSWDSADIDALYNRRPAVQCCVGLARFDLCCLCCVCCLCCLCCLCNKLARH